MLRKIILPLIFIQLAAALYAKEEILIDFGELPSGYMPESGAYIRQYDPAEIAEGDETMVDYTQIYDPSSGEAENLLPSLFNEDAEREMRLSLALDRWQVKLSGSSNFQDTKQSTQVLAYRVKDTSSEFKGEQIMAVRFDLPNLLVNSKIWIVPEFPIPPYSAAPGQLAEELAEPAMERMGQFLQKGVLRNVGAIRSITATVYGRRFPISLTIEAEHTDTGAREYAMGSLNFSGWQDLVWVNPNYTIDVRKRDYNTKPEYPRGMPSMILRALRLDRSMSAVSEDSAQVVFYIKKISVIYDNAVPETFDSEIDDEHIWQLNTVASQKYSYNQALMSRRNTVDRYTELQDRHPAYPSQDSNGQATDSSSQDPAANN